MASPLKERYSGKVSEKRVLRKIFAPRTQKIRDYQREF
jgi:hypothetical protein